MDPSDFNHNFNLNIKVINDYMHHITADSLENRERVDKAIQELANISLNHLNNAQRTALHTLFKNISIDFDERKNEDNKKPIHDRTLQHLHDLEQNIARKVLQRKKIQTLWNKGVQKAGKVGKGNLIPGARSIGEPYYLEVLPVRLPAKNGDPEIIVHLYRELLDFQECYREKWLNSPTAKSFEEFIYEDIGPNLTKEQKDHILSNSVEFLKNKEKMKYAATLEDNATITQQGERLKDGVYMFALDAKTQQLFVAEKIKGKVQHSTLTGGQAVLSAGMIKIQKGKIVAVKAYSGHYTPTAENMTAMKNFILSKIGEEETAKIHIDKGS